MSASRLKRRRSPSSKDRETGSRETAAGLAADREVALAAIRATSELDAVVPLAAPFLFVGSRSGGDIARRLEAVGLPVVDGAAFQAPGYARLPFGGAAAAEAALTRALEQASVAEATELQVR